MYIGRHYHSCHRKLGGNIRSTSFVFFFPSSPFIRRCSSIKKFPFVYAKSRTRLQHKVPTSLAQLWKWFGRMQKIKNGNWRNNGICIFRRKLVHACIKEQKRAIRLRKSVASVGCSSVLFRNCRQQLPKKKKLNDDGLESRLKKIPFSSSSREFDFMLFQL